MKITRSGKIDGKNNENENMDLNVPSDKFLLRNYFIVTHIFRYVKKK